MICTIYKDSLETLASYGNYLILVAGIAGLLWHAWLTLEIKDEHDTPRVRSSPFLMFKTEVFTEKGKWLCDGWMPIVVVMAIGVAFEFGLSEMVREWSNAIIC